MTVHTTKNVTRKKYQSYKDSGIEWLGEIPGHWEVLKTKFVANTIMGQSPSSDTYIFDGSACPFLQGNAEFGLIHPTPRYFCDTAVKKVPKGALLISVRAPVGAINIADQPYGIGRGLCAIVEDQKSLLSEFAWHVLTLTRNELWSIATGSTYEAVSVNEVADMLLPIPPLPEQRAIAAFLDRETVRIDGLIEKKQRQIELLQEKRAGLISNAVTKGVWGMMNDECGMMNKDEDIHHSSLSTPHFKDSGIEWLGEIPVEWTTQKIKNIALKIGSGKTPRGGAEVYVDSGVMLLRSQNIHFSGLRLDDVVYIEPEINAEMINTQVYPNDVLLNITGASLGRSSLVPGKFALANVNQHVCIIRPKLSKIIPPYLFSCICSNIIQSQIFANENGTSREGLNFQQIGNLIVVLPSLAEQHEIAMYLDRETARIDGLINKINESKALLREYRTALISAAVTGKIDVRVDKK